MAGDPRVECPLCGLQIEKKNMNKHFRRMHPGSDPRKEMMERRVERPRRSGPEVRRSTIAGLFISVFILFILISAILLFLSFYQEGDSQPDGPRKIFYTAGDGAVINGTFYGSLVEGSPTIYLVHDLGKDRSVWNEYAEELQNMDYNVLAIDLRGHGGSTLNIKSADITYDWTEMDHDDLMGIQLDIQGAYKWVQGEDVNGEKNTDAGPDGAMVGVGRGGLFACSQFAKMSRERMMSAVIVSPLLDVYSLDVEQVVENFGDVRPIMFAASEDDSVAALTIDRIMESKESAGETNGYTYTVPGGKIGMPLLENGGLKDYIIEVIEEGFRK